MIGAIADDYTGGTDVAVALRSQGLRTLLFFGAPPESTGLPGHDAVVVALKSRSAPVEQATAQSLAALEWLRHDGCDQIYFKYCSTFDSTPLGNIGPVLDVLADALRAETVVMTPSSPQHRRTQYQGHLFVGGTLLAESHMRDHPVNPMRDSYLPRLLRAQTAEPVGVLPLETVRADLAAALSATEDRYLLVDAVEESDLTVIGRALREAPLVAGAAGLARGLATARPGTADSPALPPAVGPAAVLSGSCSARTLEQIAAMIRVGRPAYRLDPVIQSDPDLLAAGALAWYDGLPDGAAPLIYSSMGPVDLRRTQEVLGTDESAWILERASGLVAEGLVDKGVRRLVVAGGETSGAVVGALGITGGAVGAEADVGVPWIHPVGRPDLALLLKSGNFGHVGLLVTASGEGE
ncbi:Hrp-dependent type III effector protein [Actinosynnema sp. ALI-1.44]|uniref:3-oxo-tetronate kinase n=1 Tax=Actinosynnema sp. ALI-1.44 TaxID=1933779 RepID=UPI00097C27EF|nr:3-oxo-tetronate kinase [Actinosynnema sp. ALI-1.44]ONI70900.1 Hrp-dependent type III effector protein [Actinosynnema sp. ALI-1.44]